MIITPDNEAYLIQSPLQVDEAHQLDFATKTAQANYFLSLPKYALMRITYQRDNGILSVPQNIENLRKYNYVMYKNKNYGDKWFYAYIVGMTYQSNSVTDVKLKTDVFQTYMFDYEIKQSFVERETVADDTLGKNLYPESLEYGEYITTKVESVGTDFIKSNCYICCMTSEAVGSSSASEADYINGIPRGAHIYAWDYNNLANFAFMKGYLDAIGKGSAIMSLFLIPSSVTTWNSTTVTMYKADGTPSSTTVDCYIPANTQSYKIFETYTITPSSTLDTTYVPKNNKLLQFPYRYFYVTNNLGSAIDFKYEDFYENPQFQLIGCFSQGGDYRLFPLNSKRSTVANTNFRRTLDSYPESLTGGQLPQLAWENDYYLNWEAQNRKQIILDTTMTAVNYGLDMAGMIKSVGQAGLENPEYGYASYTMAGAGENHVNDIARWSTDTAQFGSSQTNAPSYFLKRTLGLAQSVGSTLIAIENAQRVPNSVQGNANGGDLAFATNKYGFTVYERTIRTEFAERLDHYFSCFGYRVNEFKVPNLKSRRYWNYVKTDGINLIPLEIPQEALAELKTIYDNGITIWHDSSKFLNYNLTNDIISN